MHVDDIIRNYNPMYPTNGTWQDTFKVLQECPIEFDIVTQLMADLEKYGQFREPIVLSTEEEYIADWADYEFDEGESLDPYVPVIKNGTHRVFAHYLSQHKDAKVQHGWKTADDESTVHDDIYPMMASRITFDSKLDDKAADTLFGKCRSFKLTEDIWVNSDMMSSTNNTYEFYWDSGLENHKADFTALVPLIHEKVEGIAGKVGVLPVIETVILHSEAEDDAFFREELSNS